MSKTIRIHYAGGTYQEFPNQTPADLARFTANSSEAVQQATEIVGETGLCDIIPLRASSVRPLPRYVAPAPVKWVPTMACQHCVVGNARQIAVNGNTELYLCPSCGGQSTLTHTYSWGIGFWF